MDDNIREAPFKRTGITNRRTQKILNKQKIQIITISTVQIELFWF